MLTNAKVTLYHRVRGSDHDTFIRTSDIDAWWYDDISTTLSAEGMTTGTNITNVVNIRIPDISIDIGLDDIVIKGNGPAITSIKDLGKHHVVVACNKNTQGHHPHWRVRAV